MNVFVMMPFSKGYREVREAIREAVEAVGANCVIADEIEEAGAITEQMIAAIRSASVCICDITDRNENVAWEAGYASAIGKPIFVVSQSAESIFFDMKDQRTIVYNRNSLAESLKKQLMSALSRSSSFNDRVAPELLIGTQDFEKTSLVLAAPRISDTKYGFFDLLNKAKSKIYVAAQNHFFFVENETRQEYFKAEIRSFLLKEGTRLEMMLCNINATHAVQTWQYVTTDRYLEDLSRATEFFGSVAGWLASDPDVKGEFEVRAVPFVPMSISFVDPEETDGFLVFTPNLYEARNRARACFVVSRSHNPEIFHQYWSTYGLHIHDGVLLRDAVPKS